MTVTWKDTPEEHEGKDLAPILLVHGEVRCGRPLLIAEGHHRVCASSWLDENRDIPCRLGSRPELPR
jgi:hypothetical protein